MLKFCSCGSLILDDICTNKNCSLNKATKKTTRAKAVKRTEETPVNADSKVKSVKPAHNAARRNSKCITYSLAEFEKRQTEKD